MSIVVGTRLGIAAESPDATHVRPTAPAGGVGRGLGVDKHRSAIRGEHDQAAGVVHGNVGIALESPSKGRPGRVIGIRDGFSRRPNRAVIGTSEDLDVAILIAGSYGIPHEAAASSPHVAPT